MLLVPVEEKPLFWSCFRVSGMVSGEVGGFRLSDWADIMSSPSPAKTLVPGRASSLPLATISGWATWV